jgi:phospholipid transport system substrate-binding protein
MRLRACIALGVTLLIAPALARPGFAANDPTGFVAGVGRRALQILDNTQLSPAIRREEFATVVDRNFDLPAIARFTLGSYWRLATPSQREQFLSVLDAYLVDVYWSRLQRSQQYPGARLTVVSERPLGGGTTLVATQLRWPGGQRPGELDWTVTPRDGGYKIVDLSIDGVNQTLAERSQFGDLLARNGGSLPALIALMRVGSGQLTS